MKPKSKSYIFKCEFTDTNSDVCVIRSIVEHTDYFELFLIGQDEPIHAHKDFINKHNIVVGGELIVFANGEIKPVKNEEVRSK